MIADTRVAHAVLLCSLTIAAFSRVGSAPLVRLGWLARLDNDRVAFRLDKTKLACSVRATERLQNWLVKLGSD